MNLKLYLISLILILSTITSMGQSLQVTGTVKDDTGNAIVGANVVVKGTSVGVTTNLDGKYTISVPNAKSSILEFSYLGMTSMYEGVAGRNSINVTLASASTQLEEIVAIGYGVQRKSGLTGSIAKLDGKAIADIPTSNVANALQGRVAGVAIQNVTSEVGVDPTISIRGAGAMTNGNPLIIVDGYPISNGLSMLNPNDIASVEFLKDASAAAIYGSRAANGVIIVTTKVGVADKPSYSAQFYYGMKEAYKLHDMMSSGSYARQLQYENQWRLEDGFTAGTVNAENLSTQWLEQQRGVIDWQRIGLNDLARTYNLSASVSGGTKTNRYYLSMGYVHDDGMILKNYNDKFTALVKINTDLSKYVSIGTSITNVYSESESPAANYLNFVNYPTWMSPYHDEFTAKLTGRKVGSFAQPSHFMSLAYPIGDYDPATGKRKDVLATPYNSQTNNPYSVIQNSFRPKKYFQSVGSINLKVRITPDITFVSSDGYNVRYTPSTTFTKANATTAGVAASGKFGSTLSTNWLTENTLTYAKRIKKHDINVMVGFTAERTTGDYVNMEGTSFPSDDIQMLMAANQFIKTGTNTDWNGKAMASFLGRVNYSYLDRYLLSVAVRADGSSLFGIENRWATFPSASVGWRVSEEPFIKKSAQWISNLKARASYGVTGNNDIAYFANTNLLSAALYPFGGDNTDPANGLANTGSTLGNPSITWEQLNMMNLGLDFGVLNNRIVLTADYFYSKTKSLLFRQGISSISGYSSQWQNIGNYRTKGYEITIDATPVTNRNFTWQCSFNISGNRTKMLDLGGPKERTTGGYLKETHLNRVGGPVTQFYGYKVVGLWLSPDDYDKYPKRPGEVPVLGSLRVDDYDKSGDITVNDYQVIGDPNPDFIYGMTNTFEYKGIQLSFLIQGVQGGDIFNGEGTVSDIFRRDRNYNLTSRFVTPSHPGDGVTPVDNQAGISRAETSYLIEDGSYVCLRNLTLAYSLPKRITNKLGKNIRARVNFSGNNLFYIWSNNYRGINPEARYRNSATVNGKVVDYKSPMIGALQYGTFPIISTYTLGLELNF